MFDHPDYDKYEYPELPLNRDVFMVDAKYLNEYDAMFTAFLNETAEYENVGYVSYIAIRRVTENSIELSWYPTHDRYHEVIVTLPKAKFVTCVSCYNSDEKPRLFVDTKWLEDLYLRHYTIFSMIDAIGVKKAIQAGTLTKEKLLALRDAIDGLAQDNPGISFISFADSLLLKNNWTVGMVETDVKYTYSPEKFIEIFGELRGIYQKHLGMEIYGIFTQGTNEFYDENLLHISASQNHVCLNSLGTPFANLLAIDAAARQCIKDKAHAPHELYMDQTFYYSLQLKFSFKNEAQQPLQKYPATMQTEQGRYFYNSFDVISSNLDHVKKTEHA